MDRSITTKAALLAQIDEERAWWEGLLAEVGEQRMLQPGVSGDWTFKDVVAHLSAWQGGTIARLEAATRDETPAPPPWPETDDVDQINDWIYERNKDRDLADVLAESRTQWQRVYDLTAALPERDLFDPNRFAWTEGEPLGPSNVGGSFEHFHEEHEPVIREWLSRD